MMSRWASLWAAALLAAALLPSPAAGASRATTFCITVKPYLAEGVRVLVDGVDNNDWEALNGRPDNPNVLHNRVVQPGQLCVGLEVNHYSAPAFTLTLVYPPNGPEVAREAVRPSLCSYAWVMMSYCSKEASWSEEVLDYTTVTWAY